MARVPDSAPGPGTARAPLPDRASDTTAEQPWPLRLLTHNIGLYLAKMPALWVEAQVVQLNRRPGATIAFLDVRDTDTEVSMSAMAPLDVLEAAGPALRAGARVVLRVQPRFYPKRGTLSLFVLVVRPVGEGELLARLEQLKRVLGGEGLFAAERKKPLPFLPRAVGLVCGRGSAAERDVVENARQRWPAVRIELREVAVQGPGAVGQVSAAVKALDALDEVDVIVVARGGGSVEDLLPFSNEALVRVVAACRTPVVSAIGHEVDTPLLDLVADVRASTPTDAARRVVPDVVHERQVVAQARQRGADSARRRVLRERELLDGLRARPALRDLRGLFLERRHVLDDWHRRLDAAARLGVHRRIEATNATRAHLRAISPAATLERGYAIVRRRATVPGGTPAHVVRSATEVRPDERLDIALAEGSLEVTVVAGHTAPDVGPGAREAPATDATTADTTDRTDTTHRTDTTDRNGADHG